MQANKAAAAKATEAAAKGVEKAAAPAAGGWGESFLAVRERQGHEGQEGLGPRACEACGSPAGLKKRTEHAGTALGQRGP